MKKYTNLQILFAMGVIFNATSMIEAYGNSSKSSHAKEQSGEHGKSCMKSIEHDLNKIMHSFNKEHNVETTLMKLSTFDARIKQAVASMKKEEKHGKMWQTHERTLRRKVKEAQTKVKDYSKKN